MDDTDPTTEPAAADGIYATCGLCFAIVALLDGHIAWHESRGEVVPDAHDERP